MQIGTNPVKQNLYIRKINGFGQKISVEDCVKIRELKDIVRQLKSLQTQRLQQKQFNLVFKGKNITENSQSTLRQLGIPYDGIIHLVFASEQQKKSEPISRSQFLQQTNHVSHPIVTIHTPKFAEITIKVMFNSNQYEFTINPSITVLQLKKRIAARLNLIYQSLVLSHLGSQMLNDKTLAFYGLQTNTLISLRFNLHKPQKKKLQTRMVSSVTFSDENNQPNKNQIAQEFQHGKSKLATSSKSISSDIEQNQQGPKKLTSLLGSSTRPMMYKSDINSFGSNQTSKAAMMFKNALHQKIVQTQSIVSGSFSQQNSISGNDPNSLMITVKNQQDTKQFIFQCQKTHQILNIRQKLMQMQKVSNSQKIQISMEEDLFQSIDLNKSGCVTLNQIVKKMGRERAVFIYRLI